MKRIHWRIYKIWNAAFWLELALCYLLPFGKIDGFQYQTGFPIRFLTVYQGKLGINPAGSMHINLLGLLADVLILYLAILAGRELLYKMKERQSK